MGLSIVLENEQGQALEQVDDPRNFLHRLLPSHDDDTYQCLCFIDWYGDTVFNNLQAGVLLGELERLRAIATDEEKELLNNISGIVQRCKDEVHLYVRFLGD